MRKPLYLATLVFFLLHQDAWYWGDSTLVLGVFPVGFFYHLIYCLLASLLLFLLIRYAWPSHLDETAPAERSTEKEA